MVSQVRPVKRDLAIPQGENFPIARRLYHHELDGSLTLFDTSSYTAKFTVRDGDWDGSAVIEVDESDYITLGYTPAPWEATTAYGAGDYVVPTALNGFVYEVSDDGGTSDSGEPTWPTTIDQTVVDNDITWTCVSTDSWIANFYLNIPSSVTEGYSDWGAGVYTLELEDPFGHAQRLMEGSAWLSREATT